MNNTLEYDLHEILKSIGRFRRKHRVLHVQFHTVDQKWLEENDEKPEKVEKCAVSRCTQCTVDCCDVEDCDCEEAECICEECDCGCYDHDDCDKCNGTVEAKSDFQKYWKEHTSPDGQYDTSATLMVTLNHLDADTVWHANGGSPKLVATAIAADLKNEIVGCTKTADEYAVERAEAEENERTYRAAIKRLEALSSPDEETAEEVAEEENCPSIARFKRLNLD